MTTIPTERVRELRDYMDRAGYDAVMDDPHAAATKRFQDTRDALTELLTRRDAEAREGWEQRCDIYRQERDRFAAQAARMAEILGGIVAIIPKDFVAPDGRIMQFVPPDPLMYLRALANSISKAYDALTTSRQVMNPPGDEPEAGNLANTAPRQAEHDAACRELSGMTSCPEARPVTATEQTPPPVPNVTGEKL